MRIEVTGKFSVVMLLEENESFCEEYLVEQARKALNIAKKCGVKPEISLFGRNGKQLVIMELRPGSKLFAFESTEDAIDAARLIADMDADCEILGDGDKVYIKSGNADAWNILCEYGRQCEEKPGLKRLGNRDSIRKMGGDA